MMRAKTESKSATKIVAKTESKSAEKTESQIRDKISRIQNRGENC